jgi:hypothetical protein
MSLRLWLAAATLAAALFGGGTIYIRHLHGELARSRTDVERAEQATAARSLEVGGERASAQRVEVVVRQVRVAEAATNALLLAAQEAPDAEQALSAERAKRLLDHDRQLCRFSPALCRAAPAADAAGGG